MYRKYYSEYEKRAEEMRHGIPTQQNAPSPHEKHEINKKPIPLPFDMKTDDILLLAVIFFLMREKNCDKTVILALAFIFISGF
ncbi:MAG: hypothetical protein J5590_00555 [Clostridia bacterium]|nr:hypothetical protein [Clostridia bacterium]